MAIRNQFAVCFDGTAILGNGSRKT